MVIIIEPVVNQILVFSTKENLDLISKPEYRYDDRTFNLFSLLFSKVCHGRSIKQNLAND